MAPEEGAVTAGGLWRTGGASGLGAGAAGGLGAGVACGLGAGAAGGCKAGAFVGNCGAGGVTGGFSEVTADGDVSEPGRALSERRPASAQSLKTMAE